MDSFSIIQNFFTRMTCNFCHKPFEEEDVELIREEEGVFIVGVYCHNCNRQVGVAMVGIEPQGMEGARIYRDPEFTDDDIQRLSQFDPITEDDVIEAHQFIEALDGEWMQLIPPEIRERYTGSGME